MISLIPFTFVRGSCHPLFFFLTANHWTTLRHNVYLFWHNKNNNKKETSFSYTIHFRSFVILSFQSRLEINAPSMFNIYWFSIQHNKGRIKCSMRVIICHLVGFYVENILLKHIMVVEYDINHYKSIPCYNDI